MTTLMAVLASCVMGRSVKWVNNCIAPRGPSYTQQLHSTFVCWHWLEKQLFKTDDLIAFLLSGYCSYIVPAKCLTERSFYRGA